MVSVTVTNTGSASINGWSVTPDFNQSTTVSNAWSANVSGSGTSTISATNVAYNGNLGPGQSAGFGFQGSVAGNFVLPDCTGDGGSSGNAPYAADCGGATGPLLPQSGKPFIIASTAPEPGGARARRDIVLSYQYDNGGWPKNQSYDSPGSGGNGSGTFNNGATVTEMVYLAQVYRDTGDTRYRDASAGRWVLSWTRSTPREAGPRSIRWKAVITIM